MARCNNSIVGNENDLLRLFFFFGVGGGEYYKKVGLRVIAENMKLCSYLHIGKILSHRIFPSVWTILSVYIVPATRYY